MPVSDQIAATAGKAALSRIQQELTRIASAQVERLAERAAGKLTGLTEKLTDIAENDGELPSLGSLFGSDGAPLKSLVSGGAKSLKDNVVNTTKNAVGAGDGQGGNEAGDTKVTSMIEVLDIGVPLRTAYDHWTQYENFSSFTKGVGQASKSDDTTSDWKTKVGPSTRSFEATVQEQIPDDRIVWTSEGSKGTTRGAVSFHELGPTLTRVVLVVEYTPSGFFEKTGNLWRAQGRRLRLDFKHFQRYVTLTDEEPEGWRGEIRDGEVVRSHEEAMDEEEQDGEEQDGEEQDEEEQDEEEQDEEEDEDEDEWEGDEDDEDGEDEEEDEDN